MDFVIDEYADLSPLEVRLAMHADYTEPAHEIDPDVIAATGVLPQHDLLDVGSGTGSFLARLRSANHTGRLCAVDSSAAAVEAARQIDGVESVVADACALPYTDAEFDIVTARHMLYHLDSPIDAVREAKRVLRRGGRFGATVNHRRAMPRIWEAVHEATGRHGITPPPPPNSLLNSENLPDVVREVFGNVDVLTVDLALVVQSPEPVIAYCHSMLTLSGVPEDGPVREAVKADVAAIVRERFDEAGGVWRDPKGYSVCTAVLA